MVPKLGVSTGPHHPTNSPDPPETDRPPPEPTNPTIGCRSPPTEPEPFDLVGGFPPPKPEPLDPPNQQHLATFEGFPTKND